ncbi:VOC family protein [Aestuariibacter salexigens]|uniref:VOC family protein n=1 Tax=Aestuariibacter salexigens TaxID=226010 RepID=UPI0003FC23A1|nr:VOC family protein [Aestuariibacter salexigens]
MTTPAIQRIGQIAITVSDVSQALGFYEGILGLTLLFQPSDELAFLQCDSVRIMLSTPQGAGEVGKNSITYFVTTAVESVYENAIHSGATPEREPQLTAKMSDHELWIGFIRDPDGNLIGLMEEKR